MTPRFVDDRAWMPPPNWPGYTTIEADQATIRRLALIRGLAMAGKLEHMPSGEPRGEYATPEGRALAMLATIEISVPAEIRLALAARRG
jgi:hypothetical protein